MFVGRTHSTIIELDPGEERLYRLPPMSNGPVIVKAFHADVSLGPRKHIAPMIGVKRQPLPPGVSVGARKRSAPGGDPPPPNVDSSPARDLDLELRHSNHLSRSGANFILAESLWHDDLWRLRVRRKQDTLAPSSARRRYRIEASYTSQLPILERRIPASFFHDGFEANWNRQQYVHAFIAERRVGVNFTEDLRLYHGLENQIIDLDISSLVAFRNFTTTSTRLDIGAGPLPGGGAPTVFFSLRVDFKAGGKITQVHDFDIDVPAFSIIVRLYLTAAGDFLSYVPAIEADIFFDKIDDIAGADGDEKKAELEQKLLRLQFGGQGGRSRLGEFLKPWLVGGAHELFSLGYAPGPGDKPRGDGIVEPATGELIVRYVGERARPSTEPMLLDPGRDTSPPPDDGAIRLFDVPKEDPDPEPGGGSGGGGLGLFPGGVRPAPRPNIGALAKIDHIVVLMQENRSFDQVLGYLSRDKINPEVDGLLPPDHPDHQKQINRFNNRNFFPQKAQSTAWPTIINPAGGIVGGPCHETECVLSQMDADMGRFVTSFAAQTGENSPFLRLVMDYFEAQQLPVYAALARHFGICDSWYTSHAGPTWPNRFVLLTGDLNLDPFGNVEQDNPDLKTMIPIQTPTLFDHLSARGASWRVFEHGYCFLRLFGKYTFDVTNIVPFDDPVRGFEAAARAGALPQVTLIEPDYIDLPPGNDDHPPADMADGQALVNRIVRALIASPAWERTLFIITYDEHGGFYDHKQPPADAPPLRGGRSKLGPRVPAFVISPLVAPGAVFHSRFDHTSIGATILRRFGGRQAPRVSPRLDAARDLREVLTLADAPRPRTDFGSLGLPAPSGQSSRERSGARAAAKPIGAPQGKDDFHWLLSAVRLTTGQPPKVSGLRSRKPGMSTGELLYYRDRTRDGTGDVANPSVIGLGGWQALRFLFSGGAGILYAVDQSGRLLFYRDRTQDGTGDVSSPSVIGKGGWQNFRFLFSGGEGIIYAVDQNGRLLFYRDKTRDGTGDVANPTVIGKGGWQNFRLLFSGGEGIIYAVDQNGRLLFYRDRMRDGSGDVANPTVIGKGGWQNFRSLFSGGSGILYAVDQSGRLLFYRDKTQDGTGDVANPTVIGKGGWQKFKFLTSGGNGIIYAVVA